MADDYDPEKHAQQAFEAIVVFALRQAPGDRLKQTCIVSGNCITAILATVEEDNFAATRALARCFRAWAEMLAAEEGADMAIVRPQIEKMAESILDEVKKGTAFAD